MTPPRDPTAGRSREPQHRMRYVRRFQPDDFLVAQLVRCRGDRIGEVVWFCCADDRRGDEWFAQHPREGDLRLWFAALVGERFDVVDNGMVELQGGTSPSFGLRPEQASKCAAFAVVRKADYDAISNPALRTLGALLPSAMLEGSFASRPRTSEESSPARRRPRKAKMRFGFGVRSTSRTAGAPGTREHFNAELSAIGAITIQWACTRHRARWMKSTARSAAPSVAFEPPLARSDLPMPRSLVRSTAKGEWATFNVSFGLVARAQCPKRQRTEQQGSPPDRSVIAADEYGSRKVSVDAAAIAGHLSAPARRVPHAFEVAPVFPRCSMSQATHNSASVSPTSAGR